MSRSTLITLAVPSIVAALLVSLFFAWKTNDSFFRQFRSFSVTVINQSDYDLVSVETGILTNDAKGNIVKSGSKESFNKPIKAGREKVLEPSLSLSGEGGIYLQYTDSRGDTVQKTVCSYTESVSGYSTVTIHNDNVEVKENCN
ncbi:hypothetical protein [Cohnella sp. JJ-181]|uniref:hypothetical protein n=1 Tax=Cohnella rhizoplanae TaxID=2974897 RepID=UPI0022FFB3BB|nr:hypothetical protein [Cohnella sp. JJ-181]CAI6084094.1 hypothetical protein COHCIP112018_04224 [Cohnella sp. JJ-181]